MPITQLLYCSRFQFPDGDLDAVIAAFLPKAVARNSQVGITGCLAYGRGWFLQVLEGDPAVVTSLMERIGADRRHSDVKVLLQREIKSRGFPDWSMTSIDLGQGVSGFLGQSYLGQSYLGQSVPEGEFSPTTVPALSLLMTMMDIADRKRLSS